MPISSGRSRRKHNTVSISAEDLATLPPFSSVCAPMTRSQTPIWGKSVSLGNCAQARCKVARCCAQRARSHPSKSREPQKGFEENISSAVISSTHTKKLWQFMVQEAGASPGSTRRDVALKPDSDCFSPERFTFAYRRELMSWWQSHAPISPTPKSPPVSRTFFTRVCGTVCACTAPRLALHWRDWIGRRSRLWGLPSSSSQSKCYGKCGGAVTKPGPDKARNGWHLSNVWFMEFLYSVF